MDSKITPSSSLPSSRCPQCNTAVRASANFCGSCGSSMEVRSAEVSSDPHIGTLVGGRYKIKERIGQGSLGTVYMASHERIGKRVAVKFFNSDLSGQSHFARTFFSQARSSCRVNHSNAVSFNDFGATKDGHLYIIMEYAEGLDLGELLADGQPLSLDVVLDIALQLCDVLNTAHEQGVIHGDLRPENVVLIPSKGDRFTVKVLDFGIAKLLSSVPEGSQNTGVIFGAPEFTSPEQVEGEHPTPASDQYALSLLIYFMLCGGAVPFGGNDRATILYRQVHDAPTPPSSYAEMPEHLEDIVLLGLSKAPSDRFPSMQRLADALEDIIIELHDAGAFQTSDTGPELARRAAAKIERRRAAYTAREAAIQAAKAELEPEPKPEPTPNTRIVSKAIQSKTPPPAPIVAPVALEEPELRLRAPSSLLDPDLNTPKSAPDPGAIAISPNTLTIHPDDVPQLTDPPQTPSNAWLDEDDFEFSAFDGPDLGIDGVSLEDPPPSIRRSFEMPPPKTIATIAAVALVVIALGVALFSGDTDKTEANTDVPDPVADGATHDQTAPTHPNANSDTFAIGSDSATPTVETEPIHTSTVDTTPKRSKTKASKRRVKKRAKKRAKKRRKKRGTARSSSKKRSTKKKSSKTKKAAKKKSSKTKKAKKRAPSAGPPKTLD